MTVNTTALQNTQYLIENLLQTPLRIQKTFSSGDVFYFDSVGATKQDLIATLYGKYSSKISLTDALLQARADEKKFEEKF